MMNEMEVLYKKWYMGIGTITHQLIFCLSRKHLKEWLSLWSMLIVLTRDDLAKIDVLKQFLQKRFEIKDLAQLHYFRGIKVA